MGKIVKYCAACDESFAEKFGFCPNCGQPVTAFEMNPVASAAVIEEAKNDVVVEDSIIGKPVFKSSAPTLEKSAVVEAAVVAPAVQTATFYNEAETVADVVAKDEPVAPKTFAAAAGTNGNGNGNGNGNHYQKAPNNLTAVATPANDEFHITIIEEKNGKQRNGLLLASMAVILTISLGGTVYSLFNKDYGVDAIGNDSLVRLIVVEDAPVEVEKPPQPDKEGEESSGGGGGGRKDDEPVGKGTVPPQLRERILTPSNKDISVSDPAIPVTRATLGKQDIIPKNRSTRNGDQNSTNPNESSGLGPDNLGVGQNGSGGFGNNGRDGAGSNGSGGTGNSLGDGNGDGPGTGGTRAVVPKEPPALKPKPAGVTTSAKITFNPKPGYTNEARQKGVTGVVRLRVVLTATGQVGSVSSVSGLPDGLTEKAIAAAKSIKFQPAMKDGVAITSSKTIEYTFSIY